MAIEKILSTLPAWLTGGRPMRPLDDSPAGELGYYLGRGGRVWFCRSNCDWHRYVVHNPPEDLPVERKQTTDFSPKEGENGD